ncbi:7682_t:CDS:1, partial [Cetraspora pellucida]
ALVDTVLLRMAAMQSVIEKATAARTINVQDVSLVNGLKKLFSTL